MQDKNATGVAPQAAKTGEAVFSVTVSYSDKEKVLNSFKDALKQVTVDGKKEDVLWRKFVPSTDTDKADIKAFVAYCIELYGLGFVANLLNGYEEMQATNAVRVLATIPPKVKNKIIRKYLRDHPDQQVLLDAADTQDDGLYENTLKRIWANIRNQPKYLALAKMS